MTLIRFYQIEDISYYISKKYNIRNGKDHIDISLKRTIIIYSSTIQIKCLHLNVLRTPNGQTKRFEHFSNFSVSKIPYVQIFQLLKYLMLKSFKGFNFSNI